MQGVRLGMEACGHQRPAIVEFPSKVEETKLAIVTARFKPCVMATFPNRLSIGQHGLQEVPFEVPLWPNWGGVKMPVNINLLLALVLRPPPRLNARDCGFGAGQRSNFWGFVGGPPHGSLSEENLGI